VAPGGEAIEATGAGAVSFPLAVSRRLLSLTDWLPPDFGAVGQYALLDARRRAAAGDDVTLIGITSGPAEVQDEAVGAGRLRVVRIRRPAYDRGRFLRRALWTARTNTALAWAARRAVRGADEVTFAGSPPYLVHWLVPLNLLWRRPLTYRISDFHPECLIAELGRTPLPLALLLAWTRRLRRRVHRFEVLGEDQKRRLIESGVPASKIAVEPHASPVEIGPETRPLPIPEALAGHKVLLYSGNLGVAHDETTLIEGMRLHHAEGGGGVGLWLNATGAKADRLERRLRELDLPVHRSEPVPLADLGRLLVTPDAHLITLRDPFVGYVLPSKVWGCLASGRPIVFVGSAASDVHRLCSAALSATAYRRVDVGDAAALALTLREIAA
jgi:hypothetical protein